MNDGIEVIQGPASKIQGHFEDWKRFVHGKYDFVDIKKVDIHTYEDREENFAMSTITVWYKAR